MKKILFTLTLLICLSSFSQKQKATLYFKDGTKITGLAKITGSDRIKFRKNRKASKIKYTYKELTKIEIYYTDEIKMFEFKKIREKKKREELLEVILKGKVTLYKDVKHYYNSGFSVGVGRYGGVNTTMMMNQGSITSYYVSTEEENVVSHIRSNTFFNKNFKKVIAEYFKDCPSLVTKVENKEFRKNDIYEIVEYYNENCGN
jgi:hypothetical protein